MTAGGWTFMLVSLAFVWSLTVWCFVRVIKTSRSSHSSRDEE